MTTEPTPYRLWRTRLNLTQDASAHMLGIPLDRARAYDTGKYKTNAEVEKKMDEIENKC